MRKHPRRLAMPLAVTLLLPLLAAQADDDVATLRVVCERGAVPRVLHALRGTGAAVWALETDRPLNAEAATWDGAPAQDAAAVLPPPPDANRAMQEILIALSTVEDDAGTALLDVRGMLVLPTRARVDLEARALGDVERGRRALETNPYLVARGARIVPNGHKLRPEGGVVAWLDVRFTREPRGREAHLQAPSIDEHAVERAAMHVDVRVSQISRLQDDPDRRRDLRVLSREFTFSSCRFDQLVKLLWNLDHLEASVTVVDLRWHKSRATRADGRVEDVLESPVVRLATHVVLRGWK